MQPNDPLIYLLLLFVLTIWLSHIIQQQLAFFLTYVTPTPNVAITFLATLFWPGIVLHETAHYLSALLLGVRPLRITFHPTISPNGRTLFGSVTIEHTGPIRHSLIGLAPLVAGIAVLWFITSTLPSSTFALFAHWTTYPWLYLVSIITITMTPSTADRRFWVASLVVSGLLLFILRHPMLTILLSTVRHVSHVLLPPFTLAAFVNAPLAIICTILNQFHRAEKQ